MGAASPAFQSLAVAEAVLRPWTLTPFLEATSVQMKEQRPHALPVRHLLCAFMDSTDSSRPPPLPLAIQGCESPHSHLHGSHPDMGCLSSLMSQPHLEKMGPAGQPASERSARARGQESLTAT